MIDSSSLRPISWRLFWLLFVLCLFGILAIIPMAAEILGPMISKSEMPDIPLPILITIGLVQNLSLLALMIWAGLKLSRRLGLGAPLLEAWVTNARLNISAGKLISRGAITGAAVGVIVLCCLLALVPSLPNLPFVTAARVPVWKRLLACFYGGIYEETFARFFLLTLFAWIVNRIVRGATPGLSNTTFWAANLLVAILFGLGHLPSASLVMPITPLVVVVALVLNGIASVAFGHLYWKRGFESAMIAHFTADFVVWVVGPSLLRP